MPRRTHKAWRLVSAGDVHSQFHGSIYLLDKFRCACTACPCATIEEHKHVIALLEQLFIVRPAELLTPLHKKRTACGQLICHF